MTVTVAWYMVFAAVLFSMGAAGVLLRRNALVMFMSIELMLNSVNLTFIAAGSELGLIETDTDRLQSEIRNRLYEVESRYSPIDMVFLYQVIGLIGEVGDMAERTGRRLELMLSS